MASNTPVKPDIDGYITVSRQWCLKASRLKPIEKSIALGVLSLPFIRSEHGWRGSSRQFCIQIGLSRNGRSKSALVAVESAGLIRLEYNRGFNGLSIKIVDPWMPETSDRGRPKHRTEDVRDVGMEIVDPWVSKTSDRGRPRRRTEDVRNIGHMSFTTEVVERDERDERVKIGDSQDPIAEFKDERDESQDPTAESENVVYESPEEPPALQRKLEANRKKFFESTQREAGQDPIAEFESVVDVSPVQLPPPLKKKPISPPPKRDPRKYRDRTKVTREQVTAFQDWLNEADFTVSGARSRAQRVYKARSLYELTYGALLEIYDYYRDRGAARDKALAEKGLFNA